MKSEQIDKLVKALIKAQSEIKPVVKSKVNPFFHSKYADLATIDEAVKHALHSNGLCVVQTTEMIGSVPTLETTLLHESGQWISGQYPLMPVKQDPQALGSSVTYARRYALSAILGVVADEDDDGNAASAHTTTATKTETKRDVKHEAPVDSQTVSFVPADVSEKSSEKTGKTWFSIKSPSGDLYSTFDEKIANEASTAKEEGRELEIEYKLNGKFRNIVDAVMNVAF